MKRKVGIPLFVAFVAFIVLVVILRSSPATDTDVQYLTGTATKGTIISSVEGTGNVAIGTSSTVTPTVSGTVTGLKVAVGDTVTKGQRLYYIDDDGQLDIDVTKGTLAIDQAQLSLENSRASLLKAQTDLTDAQTKNEEKEGNVSDEQLAVLAQQIVAAQSKVTNDERSVVYAQESLALQKKAAAKRSVTAPIDGIVTTLSIANGDDVTAGSGASGADSSSAANTIVIDDLSSLQMTVAINEVDAGKIEVDQKVSITFDAIEELILSGKVTAISHNGTVTSGVVTYDVVVKFDSLDSRVRPSMTATAAITTAAKTDVTTVPTTAIKTGGDGVSYVQVMENGTPRRQVVETGISSDTDTEITAGLTEGQEVVTGTVSSETATSSNNQPAAASLRSVTGASGGGAQQQVFESRPF